jgi:hypothetical protein
MPSIAHRPPRLMRRAPQRLTMWLVGALLVAAVAATLALSLSGGGSGPTDRSADAPPAAQQPPTQWGGARP